MPDVRNIINSIVNSDWEISINTVEDEPTFSDTRDLGNIALNRAAQHSSRYSILGAPVSPHENLSGNSMPEETPLRWLIGRYKCNQFVGDVLTAGGYDMPTYIMTDGSEHYVNAETLPKYRDFFTTIDRLEDLRIGDIVVIDHAGTGEDSAHVEVVTGRSGGMLRMTGAHFDGAYEKNYASLLQGLVKGDGPGKWYANGKDIYLLRPKVKL